MSKFATVQKYTDDLRTKTNKHPLDFTLLLHLKIQFLISVMMPTIAMGKIYCIPHINITVILLRTCVICPA